MGLHPCAHPCWHRALILVGTLGYWYASFFGMVALWHISLVWMPAAWLVSTWLVKHLLQWRCQGREPSTSQAAAGLLLLVGSAAYMMREHDDV